PETKDGVVTLDFTFDASKLAGKEIVVFEDLYRDNKLVVSHADINDKDQTVKVKPEQPKPEQPKPEQPKPEQPKPEQPKPEQPKQPEKEILPNTGLTLPIAGLIGLALLAIGGVFFFIRRKNA
ncbi:VaFE repeat-containing surface-anchored protein, partial [Bacillus cereus]|uniref:VaFE repeat-containing surface-anchored protein n=1 Tax=Bacillus cereus TaxID=1396 RepID=UPI0018795843